MNQEAELGVPTQVVPSVSVSDRVSTALAGLADPNPTSSATVTGVRQEQWQELNISGLGEKTEKYCRPPPVPCQESNWNFTYLLVVFCVMFSVY